MPTTSCRESRSVRTSASPRWPALPVTKSLMIVSRPYARPAPPGPPWSRWIIYGMRAAGAMPAAPLPQSGGPMSWPWSTCAGPSKYDSRHSAGARFGSGSTESAPDKSTPIKRTGKAILIFVGVLATFSG